jgi:CBS domain-containing protein
MTRVGEILRRKGSSVVTVAASASVSTAVELLMRHGVGGLAVVDVRGALTGFVSERDLIAALHRDNADMRQARVGTIMRAPPTCRADDTVRSIMTRMTTERLRHLVVMEDDQAIGVVSVGDIVKHRLEELETETGVLRDYVAAQRAV